MTGTSPAGSRRPRRSPRGRRLGRFLFAVLGILIVAAFVLIDARVEDWARARFVSSLAHALDARVELGSFQLRPWRLEASFADLRIHAGPEGDPWLVGTVRAGRARLTWGALGLIAGGSLHLAELEIVAPDIATQPGLWRARDTAASAAPFVLRIDRLQVREGRWQHLDRQETLDFEAHDVEVGGDWEEATAELSGRVALRFAVRRPPLVEPAPLHLEGRFTWRGHEVELRDVHVEGAGGQAELEGSVLLHSGVTVVARGELQADLGWIGSHLDPDFPALAGVVSGPITFEAGADVFNIQGRLDGRRARFGAIAADSLRVVASYRPGRLSLEELVVEAFGGQVRGTVEVQMEAPPRFSTDLKGSGLDGRRLVDWIGLPLPLAGRVDADLRLAGLGEDRSSWVGEAGFICRAADARAWDLPTTASGTVGFDRGEITVHAPDVRVAAATFDLRARTSLDAGSRPGLLRVAGSTDDAERTQRGTLRILQSLGLELKGIALETVQGAGRFDATIGIGSDAPVSVALDLSRGSFGGQSFEQAELTMLFTEGAVDLPRIVLRDGATEIAGSAGFDRSTGQLTALDVAGEDVDPTWLARMADFGPLPLTGGRIGGTLRLVRTPAGMQGSGDLGWSGAEWLEEPLDLVHAELEVVDGLFLLPRIAVSGPALRASARADWQPDTNVARLFFEPAEIDLALWGTVAESGVPLAGRVVATGEIRIEPARIDGTLALSGAEIALGPVPLGRVRGQMQVSDERVELQVVAVDGGFTGQGRLDLGATPGFEVEVEVGSMAFDLPETGGVSGWVELAGRLTASSTDIRDRASLQLEGSLGTLVAQLGTSRFSGAAPVAFRLVDNRLEVEGARLRGGATDVVGNLTYDLGSAEIEARISGDVDLALLSAVSPDLRASGTAHLDLRGRGSAKSPLVRGTLSADDGRIRILGWPQSLDRLAFAIEVDNETASIRELRARVGNGEIRARGSAAIEGWLPGTFEVEVDVANVQVAAIEGFRGAFEGKLVVRGSPETATIAGELNLLRGLYDRNLDLSLLGSASREYGTADLASLPDDVKLDVAVTATDEVWVRNDLANLEAAFDLRVRGSLQRPEVTGRIRALEGGELVFRDVTYEILSASIDFLDVDRLDPYLTLRCQTVVGDHTVFLRVEGRLDKFEYELTSDPALATQDIIALLTTGRTLEGLTPGRGDEGSEGAGDLAANYFAGALTARFSKGIERIAHLDRVQIDPLLVQAQADPTARITLGEEVADDVFVIFSTDLDQTDQQLYQVEWRATPKFRVTAERDTLGGVGSSVHYTNRFWWSTQQKLRERERRARPEATPGASGSADSAAPRVASIALVGVPEAEVRDVLKRLPFEVGAPYTRSALFKGVEAVRRYFVVSGRIEAAVDARVGAAAGGSTVVYEVESGPAVEVTFEGTTKKESRALLERLESFWVERVFADDLYEDSAEEVRQDFRDRGFYAVDVEYRVEDESGLRRVAYQIDRGKPVVVASVEFEGAQEVALERIRRQMLTREDTAFSRRLLEPAVLQEDLQAVRNLYRELGYLGAEVDPPRIELSSGGDSARIRIAIREGMRFTLGAIRYPAGLPFSEDEMRGWSGLVEGEYFSESSVLQGESRLRARLDERGYPDARVRGRVERGEGSVRLEFEVDPGALQRVGEVQIQGNRLTRASVIRREIELKEGDLISREALLRSQRRLYKLGLFRNVTLSYGTLPSEDPSLRRLDVVVDEAPPMSTSVGAGYDTEAGARGSFSLTNDNLGGSNRLVSFQGRASGLERRLQVVGREPRLFGRQRPGLLNVFWEEREEVGFTTERLSTALRADWRWNTRWASFARYALERVALSQVDISPEELQEERLVDGRLGQFELAWIRDTRDDPFLPRRGSRFTASTKLFSRPLLSEFSFVKSNLSAAVVRSLGERKSAAAALRIGFAYPFGPEGTVPISEAFFAGGANTLRGFRRDEVGPASGGEVLLLLNQEYRFPIVGQLKGVAFYDAGNVFENSAEFELGELRHVLGVGVRFETPIGPVRLEYGRKLDRVEGESLGELFLSIGEPF